MTQEDIKDVSLELMKSFNNEKVELSDQTVMNEVLSTNDSFNSLSASANVFKGFFLWTLSTAKHSGKYKFPKNWLDLTVETFSKSFAILLVLLSLSFLSYSQLSVQLGTVKTDAKQTALNIGITYAKSLDSIWNTKELFIAGKHSIFTVTPQIKLETGTQDAFSSLEAKLTGLFMTFKTTDFKTTSGTIVKIPNLSKIVNTFPISIGAESNNTFSSVNGILEAGWVPWYQSETSTIPDVFKYTKLGVFLQAGYKFKGDSLRSAPLGGNIDESWERINTGLLRTKGSFTIDTKKIGEVQGLNLGVVGSADLWYDFMNAKFYHKVETKLRFYLTDGQYFDVLYSKGSGAPNFNTGDQYGVGLVMKF